MLAPATGNARLPSGDDRPTGPGRGAENVLYGKDIMTVLH